MLVTNKGQTTSGCYKEKSSFSNDHKASDWRVESFHYNDAKLKQVKTIFHHKLSTIFALQMVVSKKHHLSTIMPLI